MLFTISHLSIYARLMFFSARSREFKQFASKSWRSKNNNRKFIDEYGCRRGKTYIVLYTHSNFYARVRLIRVKEGNEQNLYIFLMFCLLHMSEEKNIGDMVYVLVSCGNIERMKAIGKMGNTFDDVVTMLLIIMKTCVDRSGSIQRAMKINSMNN